MHKNFGEWYRLVTIEPDGTKLPKRWAGVETWTATFRHSDENLLETVRIFQGLPSKVSRDAFLEVFRKQDPAFPQRNCLELRVLAGACLVECVQTTGPGDDGVRAAALAGTALEASSLFGAEPQLSEISREVADGLRAISVEQRKRKSVNSDAVEERENAATEAMKEISTISDFADLKTVVTPIFKALVEAIQEFRIRLDNAAHSLRAADEETNILWWMEGGYSRDNNKSWPILGSAAAIVAGTELADLTDVALGPRDAAALLERVLSETNDSGREAPLADYVNALPDEWIRERTADLDEGMLDLTPLSLATFHRAKSDTASWQKYFDSSSALKSSTQLTASRIARQAYVEAMLLGMLADTDAEA